MDRSSASLSSTVERKPHVYVLLLAEGKYLVGTIGHPDQLQDYFRGDGPTWTQRYQPQKLLHIRYADSSLSDNELTFQLMARCGVDNVRGGDYCEPKFSEETLATIKKEVSKYELEKPGDSFIVAGGELVTRSVQFIQVSQYRIANNFDFDVTKQENRRHSISIYNKTPNRRTEPDLSLFDFMSIMRRIIEMPHPFTGDKPIPFGEYMEQWLGNLKIGLLPLSDASYKETKYVLCALVDKMFNRVHILRGMYFDKNFHPKNSPVTLSKAVEEHDYTIVQINFCERTFIAEFMVM